MELRQELENRESLRIQFLTHPIQHCKLEELNGGVARNVIADQCTVDWELRPVVFGDGVFVNQTHGKICQRNCYCYQK